MKTKNLRPVQINFNDRKKIRIKKATLILTSITLLLSLTINAQGWIGNSNNLISYNSSLNLTPLKVGIGVNSPTSLFHTNGTLRFDGLSQATGKPFDRLLITDSNGNVKWYDLNSLSQGGGDTDWLSVTTNQISTSNTEDIYTEGRVFMLDNPIGNRKPRTNVHITYTNDTEYNPRKLPILSEDPKGGGLLIDNRSTKLNSRATLTFISRDSEKTFEATSVISNIATGVDKADLVFQNEYTGPAAMRETMRITSDGDVYLPTSNRGVILTSSNGNCWKLTVDNTGNPVYTSVTCP
ncbi:hypothetical protein ES677_13610 [Bizionia gelidisalsuginis]|uniref:Uncharacterized protein n=1 Tax=Bizionia gelidisalsuginis TaxID=291188 RepID=A0ABY3M7G6_9FLAO|nr:hypothetical protein [Bizionia gelidisalsuginis]TYC09135.1 hypothetical protein ES677_13610 [Bizionia gelidisalsuginis]